MFGYMALKFGVDFVDINKDKEPSVAKTVRRVVSSIKELFFDQNNANVRNACFMSLCEILENCFANKRIENSNEKARDLIFQPLYEELSNPKLFVTRQTACYILLKLNEKYQDDPDIVNPFRSQGIIALGLKNKIYDGEFLMAVGNLINLQGVALTLGEMFGKSMTHFIASVKYNLTG
jgi:hypothetical protein